CAGTKPKRRGQFDNWVSRLGARIDVSCGYRRELPRPLRSDGVRLGHGGFGSRAAVATTLASWPVHPRQLPTYCNAQVGSLGPRPCENSDVVPESRISISISKMRKPRALTTLVLRPQQRKLFTINIAKARFHTAWATSGHGAPGCRQGPVASQLLPR